MLMNWNQRQLRAFFEVCRVQSFSKAAERVAISQSGLSMLVRELEAQLGARLFDRTTRSVTLTDAGRRLQPVAERVLAELDSVSQAIAGSEASTASRLTVAATPMISANLLPTVLRGFRQTHPNVSVRLDDVDVDTVQRKLLAGEVDIGLGFFFKPAVSMRRTPLCQFRLMRISPSEGGHAGMAPARPWKALADVPLIALPAHNPIQSLIDKHLAAVGQRSPERPSVNLIGTIVAMVEAGLGQAVVPSFALPECLRHRISVSMLVEPAVRIDLMLASRASAKLPPVVSDFAAALSAAAAGIGR
jgi:LysR family transcriptional regulator, carnitine catabolism transcriptional activator